MGFFLQNGKGVPVNKEEAIKYYRIAIDLNEPQSMYYLTQMLDKGDGIDVNKEEAKYLKMTANCGIRHVIPAYANMRENGIGVDVDMEEVASYYRMAGSNGDINSIYKYAFMTEN